MGSSAAENESPITPVGLEACRREQLGEVIEQLAGYFDNLREAARYNEDDEAITARVDSVLERELW